MFRIAIIGCKQYNDKQTIRNSILYYIDTFLGLPRELVEVVSDGSNSLVGIITKEICQEEGIKYFSTESTNPFDSFYKRKKSMVDRMSSTPGKLVLAFWDNTDWYIKDWIDMFDDAKVPVNSVPISRRYKYNKVRYC